MPRTPEGWRALRVPMPIEEFEYLAKLRDSRGPRKWRTYFQQIQDDARMAAELNQKLRARIEFLEGQLARTITKVE